MRKLDFSVTDLRDSDDLQIRLKVLFKDLDVVLNTVECSRLFNTAIVGHSKQSRLPRYLAKTLVLPWQIKPIGSLWTGLLTVQVANWVVNQNKYSKPRVVIFVSRQPWMNVMIDYARTFKLETAILWGIKYPNNQLVSLLFHNLKAVAVRLKYRRWSYKTAAFHPKSSLTQTKAINSDGLAIMGTQSPKIAAHYLGQLNISRPELHSDLSFYDTDHINGEDVIVTYTHPRCPVDLAQLVEIREHRMEAVAMHPGATNVEEVKVISNPIIFHPNPKRIQWNARSATEEKWMRNQVASYWDLRTKWERFFRLYNAKIFVTWNKFDASHCAIADAMEALGGITAIYQRAFECDSSPETTMAVDVAFGYSRLSADIERGSRSHIPYYVITGYIGDHRFDYWRRHSGGMRERLAKHGARKIIAFLDENTSDDPRWSPGHHTAQRDYEFLLRKVIDNPWLGLLIKPKVPRSLRKRLGPIAELLKVAEGTGRCFVYEEGTIQGSYPPASAALAADIAIHSSLVAATAGLEMSLSGVPTLLMDHEGWHRSPLYQLGEGKVVFQDWDQMWDACQEHWSTSEGNPELGDWSNMLPELDPFRDGRAAERMGTYLGWLLEGFKENQERGTILEAAAERYRDAWGEDKIVNLTERSPYWANV